MHTPSRISALLPKVLLLSTVLAPLTLRAAEGPSQAAPVIVEIMILGSSSHSETGIAGSAGKTRSPLGSVITLAEGLPGLSSNQGDSFGLDDWSSTISMRGYQVNLGEQQLGMTIDGFPNGGSSYTSGSRANRYLDPANLAGIRVAQGTADIGSPSLEALGGTLDFVSDLPLDEQRTRLQMARAAYAGRRHYVRVDSGNLQDGSIKGWAAFSGTQGSDWMARVAENTRRHAALRLRGIPTAALTLDAYLVRDAAHEDNHERLSRAQFEADPYADGLTAEWTGTPYIDQQYRRGWSTLRNNRFGYLKAAFTPDPQWQASAGVYAHRMQGRGDWLPPFVVDLVDDGSAAPQSELAGKQTWRGGQPIGSILFTDAQGRSLQPLPGCSSSLTFPYGGAGPEYDPACHAANAQAQQSYRHTHYDQERSGLLLDLERHGSFRGLDEYSLQAGLWHERGSRQEQRDWHRIEATRVGMAYAPEAYWLQFDNQVESRVLSYHAAATAQLGKLELTAGLRRFQVDLQRQERLSSLPERSLRSRSRLLWSFGGIHSLPWQGWELFAGVADNAKPLTEAVLVDSAAGAALPDAEHARNEEIGLRFSERGASFSAVLFRSTFDDKVEYFAEQLQGDIPDYLRDLSGSYDNVGGLSTRGIELGLSMALKSYWSLVTSVSATDATYLGSRQGAAVNAFLGLAPGSKVVATPALMFTLGIHYADARLGYGLTSRYVGERYIDRANTTSTAPYTLVDAHISWKLQPGRGPLQAAELQLVVSNATDKRYQAGIVGFGAWTGAPRTASLALTVDF